MRRSSLHGRIHGESRQAVLACDPPPPRTRVAGEGQSLYFYDFDNHLFELHTGTLEERLQGYVQ